MKTIAAALGIVLSLLAVAAYVHVARLDRAACYRASMQVPFLPSVHCPRAGAVERFLRAYLPLLIV